MTPGLKVYWKPSWSRWMFEYFKITTKYGSLQKWAIGPIRIEWRTNAPTL